MIEFLLLDLDDTILDFHKAERIALSKTIRDFGVEPTEEVLNRYHHINKWHWEQLELGLMTRDQVLVGRFHQLFEELGMEVDAAACMKRYERNLSMGHYFLPGAEEAVKRLKEHYRLFLVSNGLASGFPELGKSGAAEVIEKAGFDANIRGETLGIPEFAKIANEIVKWREK